MAFVRKWYMADPHFGHPLMQTQRGFASVAAMDQFVIDRVIERVGQDDILYILGDFALSSDDAYVRRCFHALPGRKHLIIGNHDVDRDGVLKPVLAKLPWAAPPTLSMTTSDNGQRLYLSHYAHRVWPGDHKDGWHFFGHSHNRLSPMGRSRDVGIDCPDTGFGPLTFTDLTAGMVIEE